MSWTPDKISAIEREARYRLNWTTNRVWGVKVPYEDDRWKVDIYTPRKTKWAKAVAWNKKPEQSKTHIIKNQKTATHKASGLSFTKTTWLCGATTYTKPVIVENPNTGCGKCHTIASGTMHGEVKL